MDEQYEALRRQVALLQAWVSGDIVEVRDDTGRISILTCCIDKEDWPCRTKRRHLSERHRP